MGDVDFASHYDTGTSTLVLRGTVGREAWARLHAEVDRAYRRTACTLTIDLTHADVEAQLLGLLVHMCNLSYRGTVVRPPARQQVAVA